MPKRDERIFIGLHSGPTGDGVDAALVAIAGHGVDIKVRELGAHHHPYAPALAVSLRNLSFGNLSFSGEPTGERLSSDNCPPPGWRTLSDIADLDELIALAFAETVSELLRSTNVSPKSIAAIGSAGHRIGQIDLGAAASIAGKVGRPVIAGFAANYIAAGGQGVATDWCDWRLFRDDRLSRVVVGLGALATVTFVPADAQLGEVVSIDAGPGMCVIDALCRRLLGRAFDAGGECAAGGKADLAVVNELLAHRYFQSPPPKRALLADWGDVYVERFILSARRNVSGATPEDMLATASELTARAVARSAGGMTERPHQVILCGGGAMNHTLLGRIRTLLCPSSTITSEKFGLHVRAKQAACYAMLAAERQQP